MAWKRHLWSTDQALVTFLRLDDLMIFYFMSYTGLSKKSSSYSMLPTKFVTFLHSPEFKPMEGRSSNLNQL